MKEKSFEGKKAAEWRVQREIQRAEESAVRDALFEMEIKEPQVKAEFIRNIRVKGRKQSGVPGNEKEENFTSKAYLLLSAWILFLGSHSRKRTEDKFPSLTDHMQNGGDGNRVFILEVLRSQEEKKQNISCRGQLGQAKIVFMLTWAESFPNSQKWRCAGSS